MKKLLPFLAIGALVAFLVAPMAKTQPTGWISHLTQDPQGAVMFRALDAYGFPAMIGHGTAAPTAANDGAPPMDGEMYTIRTAGAEPVPTYYSTSATAWRSFMQSTLATNAPNVANSVWFGASQIIAEGLTPNGFETDLEFADVAQDQDVYLGDYGEADTSFVISTVDDMDLGEANAVWVGASSIIFEGTGVDAFEGTLGIVNPVRDGTINLNPNIDGQLRMAHDGEGGYWGGSAYPNPWRFDWRATPARYCEFYLEDHSAGPGVADTNENVALCGAFGYEYWVEQAVAGAAGAFHGFSAANANGLLMEFDDTANDGYAIRFFGGDDGTDVGWNCVAQTDACYFEASIIVNDSSETDQVLFGLLTREAFSADAEEDAFDTYCLVGIDDTTTDPRDIVISEEINGGGGANTDTTVDIVDGTAIVLRVELEADGTCDIWVNGTETNTDVMTFDAADFVVPMASVIASAGDGTPDVDVTIQWVEVGYIN